MTENPLSRENVEVLIEELFYLYDDLTDDGRYIEAGSALDAMEGLTFLLKLEVLDE